MAIRKLNKLDYAIGQIVALRWDNNKARGGNHNKYTLGTVTKIGNKILYIDDVIKINMETGMVKSNYASDYVLYDSEQELLNTLESEKLLRKIRNKIGQYGEVDVSLEKLRLISEILELQ